MESKGLYVDAIASYSVNGTTTSLQPMKGMPENMEAMLM
jgi:hypothetical protein